MDSTNSYKNDNNLTRDELHFVSKVQKLMQIPTYKPEFVDKIMLNIKVEYFYRLNSNGLMKRIPKFQIVLNEDKFNFTEIFKFWSYFNDNYYRNLFTDNEFLIYEYKYESFDLRNICRYKEGFIMNDLEVIQFKYDENNENNNIINENFEYNFIFNNGFTCRDIQINTEIKESNKLETNLKISNQEIEFIKEIKRKAKQFNNIYLKKDKIRLKGSDKIQIIYLITIGKLQFMINNIKSILEE